MSSQGKTVIAILHDMDFVAESFERVIVMAHGKVLALSLIHIWEIRLSLTMGKEWKK